MKNILFVFVLIFSNLMFSQVERTGDSFGINDDVKILNTPHSFYNSFSEYRLNNSFFLRTGLRERNVDNHSFLEIPVLAKHFITDKFSVLAGPKLDILKINSIIEETALFSTLGLQYNITKEFSIEGRANYMMSEKSSSPIIYRNNMKYKLGTRLKF